MPHSRQSSATGRRPVIAIPDNLINDQAANIARFAETRRVPAISGWAEFAEAGNLMSYGPNVRAYYRRVAGYVDKLLRGARPADLPVELPTEFEFVVNLRAAGAHRPDPSEIVAGARGSNDQLSEAQADPSAAPYRYVALVFRTRSPVSVAY